MDSEPALKIHLGKRGVNTQAGAIPTGGRGGRVCGDGPAKKESPHFCVACDRHRSHDVGPQRGERHEDEAFPHSAKLRCNRPTHSPIAYEKCRFETTLHAVETAWHFLAMLCQSVMPWFFE